MPVRTFSASVAAGATYLPLSDWQYRFPPKTAMLELIYNATAAGCVGNLTTGSESIIQAESPVSAGGTAGVIPSRFTQEPIVDMVDPGQETVLTVRNTTGGAITVSGIVVLTYK